MLRTRHPIRPALGRLWLRRLRDAGATRLTAVVVALATMVAVVVGAAVLRAQVLGDESGEGVTPGPRGIGSWVAPHRPGPAVAVTKVLTIVVENHNIRQMRAQMPYLWRLAGEYGYATGYRAIRHPSLPNYLSLLGGSTFGVTDDADPAHHPVSGSSVLGQALAHGGTAAMYLDEMASHCQQTNQDTYAVRHNPWAYFVDERASCRRLDVPVESARSGTLVSDIRVGRLPTVSLLIPDTCNDAHDHGCTLGRADRWLRSWVPQLLDGPDFRSGRLAVVVTADEDDRHLGNKVLTVVANAGLRHVVARASLTHFSLSGFMSQVAGGAPLRDAAAAPSFAKAFGLRTPRPGSRTPGAGAG